MDILPLNYSTSHEIKSLITTTLRQRQKAEIVHMLQHDSLLRTVVEGKTNKSRTKPRV